jgi:hypothetical protein
MGSKILDFVLSKMAAGGEDYFGYPTRSMDFTSLM